jgi:hypothetical protein
MQGKEMIEGNDPPDLGLREAEMAGDGRSGLLGDMVETPLDVPDDEIGRASCRERVYRLV